MSNRLEVTVSNETDELKLIFDIYKNDISDRWASEINNYYEIYESNRFKGFPGKDQKYYEQHLKTHINIINEYNPNTIKNIDITSQDNLNYLHKFFETLRGHIETGTEFYNTAPDNIKQSVDVFNVLIHEYEHFLRDQGYPTLVVTFKDRPRHRLNVNDYNEFTFKWNFGEVYINYCEVGKPLLDVYKDKDEYVGNENIRPLEYYSADFMIKFGPSTTKEIFYRKLEDFNTWYKTTGLTFKNLSLGLIPVAKINMLESNFDNCIEEEIIEIIGKYNKVKKVCIR